MNYAVNYATSESIKAIAPALVAAQAAVETASKDAKNPHFGNSFASLQSLWDAAKPALAANGRAMLQHLVSDENCLPGLHTVLWHKSGEWIGSTIYLPADKPGIQSVGSLMTYLRRYSLQSVLGICAEEDDDGGDGKVDESKPAEPAKTAKPLTDQERSDYDYMIETAETQDRLLEIAADMQARDVGDDRGALTDAWKARKADIEELGV